MNIGRKLQLQDLEPYECYVSQSLFKSLKFDPNKKENILEIKLKLSSIFKQFGNFNDLIEKEEVKKSFEGIQFRSKSNHNNSELFDQLIKSEYEVIKTNNDKKDEINLDELKLNKIKSDQSEDAKIIKNIFKKFEFLNNFTIDINNIQINNFLNSKVFKENEIFLELVLNSDLLKILKYLKG